MPRIFAGEQQSVEETFLQGFNEASKYFLFEPVNRTLTLNPEWMQAIMSGEVTIPGDSIELTFELDSDILGRAKQDVEIKLLPKVTGEQRDFDANITVTNSEEENSS